MSVWADGWRLSVGTLTALPVRPPAEVDRRRAGVAIAMAPVTALLLAIPAAAVVWIGRWIYAPPIVVAVVVVVVLALGSRGLHLDGLADTADGLAAPKDASGRLAVMRRGDVGPVGAATLMLVLLAQVAAFTDLAGSAGTGAALVLAVVCASRCALAVVCANGVPAARGDGLGAAVAGSVPRVVVLGSWLLLGALVVAAAWWTLGLASYATSAAVTLSGPEPPRYYGDVHTLVNNTSSWWWAQTIAAVVASAGAVALLVRRAVRTLGGVTGDVCGAAVEIALAVLLVVLVV